MAWTTVCDIIHVLPIDVFDANGMVIRRAITAFDPATGEVESLVMERDGSLRIDSTGGAIVRRRETYPAPLIYKKISETRVQQVRSQYRDLEGED